MAEEGRTERRHDMSAVVDSIGFLRADIALGNGKLDRLDERTQRIEKALFFGGDREAGLITEVAVQREQIRGIKHSAERGGARAGATWGTVGGTAITAVLAFLYWLATGRPPGSNTQ